MSERPNTRLKVLAKKLGLKDAQLAMVLLFVMSHDKAWSWKQTLGYNSKSNNPSAMANQAFNNTCIKEFIEQLGGVMIWETENYLTYRGNNKPLAKKITALTNDKLFNNKKAGLDLTLIEDKGISMEIKKGIEKIYEDERGVSKSDRENLSDEKKESSLSISDNNDIKFRADMSRSEYLDYLIQEQGLSANQKDKNAFTLKIAEYMNFKEDKSNELRPVLYLPFRFEDIGLCPSCSALIRTFTK